MNNIFEGAYFGKQYKTRGEKKAIYLGGDRCWIEGENDWRQYYSSGNWIFKSYQSKYDIVSEWEEEINEEELDKLAVEYADHAEMTGTLPDGYNTSCWDYLDIVKAFKAGYRKKAKGYE